ncbi:MAG: Ig-like domain-containing protein [Cyanobacteria bacterium NC_groundwater_1444_Ag_S-0.65um_54_12]|nr:Ig-like domain-containing protein [Cyanobacteria bacterium NC_groundwater_1444_Ag_S-0.65um_54_12]
MFRRLITSVLPIIILGCQASGPNRLASPQLPGAGNPVNRPATAEPLVAPQAKAAVIATEPAAIAQRPAGYGGMVLTVKWPKPASRKTQLIPTTANSLWIKAYAGSLGTRSSVAAPDQTPIASRIVDKGTQDTIPSATPTPYQCCNTPAAGSSTVFLSLPAGTVTVWVGTFAEAANEVASASVFLSSGQLQATILANKIAEAKTLSLGANPAIAPAISSVTPSYVGPGGKFTIAGSNFGDETPKVTLYQEPTCPGCWAPSTEVTVNSASSTSIAVTVPKTANTGTFQIKIEANGFTITGSEVGILDSIEEPKAKNLASSANLKQIWVDNQTINMTVVGAQVKIDTPRGRVSWSQDPVDLPLSWVVVKVPGGATRSLDASASFTADAQGTYTVEVKSGEKKGSLRIDANNVYASARTTHWEWEADETSVMATRSELVSFDWVGQTLTYPESLYYNVKGWFVDASNQKIVGSELAREDFSWSGSGLAFDPFNPKIMSKSVGDVVLTATLKANPTLSYTKTVTVIGPTKVIVSPPDWIDMNNFWVGWTVDMFAKVRWADPSKPAISPEDRGKDSDFTWESLNPSIATVNSNGVVTGVAGGTAVIKATLNNDVALVGTASVTVKQNQ